MTCLVTLFDRQKYSEKKRIVKWNLPLEDVQAKCTYVLIQPHLGTSRGVGKQGLFLVLRVNKAAVASTEDFRVKIPAWLKANNRGRGAKRGDHSMSP